MPQSSVPPNVRLNLHPGEWYFGCEYQQLYTLLGSCVALTVWHPKLKIGGMCHYVLPTASEQRLAEELRAGNSGRYGATVLSLLKQKMLTYAAVKEYRVELFGGSDGQGNFMIGKQNIVYARQWLAAQKITPVHTDVGGNKSRSLVFDILSGEVKVKFYMMNE